jgi:hypothetical protein
MTKMNPGSRAKTFKTECSVCGKTTIAHVTYDDFVVQNRFSGEYELMEETVVETTCTKTTNPTHQRNSGGYPITLKEWKSA